MENPIYIALSRLTAQRRNLDVVAHNIANANTAGFQGDKVMFRQYLHELDSGEKLTFGHKAAFVHDIGAYRDTAQGALRQTGGQFDLAIEGEGYFTVETPLGPRYTRNGRFQINAEGQLTTALGYRVLDNGGNAIQFPEGTGDVRVAPNGVVEAKMANQQGVAAYQPVARIEVVTFENQQEMKHIEQGLFTAAGEELPSENAAVLQGMVEESNISPIEELTNLIEVQRMYNHGKELMKSEHERLRAAIRTLTRTSG